jgi:hypothetical protein
MNLVIPTNQQLSRKPRGPCNIYMVYIVQSSATTNTSATNIAAANISSAELCSIATDDMTLSNELQNAIAVVPVVQTSTSKTAKEFEFGFWQKKNQFI